MGNTAVIIENNLSVTDHAIVRYFERVLGYDIEEIKAKILPDGKAVDNISKLGNCVYPIDNFKVRIVNCKVITVLI
jgi:hypothetical protein